MTDQERNQVLKMIQDGKISPEEGLRLMQALDQSPADEAIQASQVSTSQSSETGSPEEPEVSKMETDARILSIKSTVRRLWWIPLWIGVGITVLSALGMFLIMRGPGLNFWFYYMVLPLLLGVAVITIAVGSHTAHWIFVDVHQKPGDHPEHIFLGFPLPLKFAAWVLRTLKHWIPNFKSDYSGVNIDQIIEMVENGIGNEPLIAHVDDGEGGEKVRVFIG